MHKFFPNFDFNLTAFVFVVALRAMHCLKGNVLKFKMHYYILPTKVSNVGHRK